ncbi:SPL family radical SAM protein, partial [Fervidicoccus fontis]
MKVGNTEVHFIEVKSAISQSGLPDLDYALNPYLGCSHGCIYCYARLYTKDERASKNWGKVVLVKTNLVEVLKKEVKRKKKGIVGVGTITDAYQPLEAIYKLTRRSVKILLESGFYLSFQTKNPLILRDKEILLNYREKVDVGFTITSLKSSVSKFIEPNAPFPISRANAIRALSKEGIKTWIFYGPIIPRINDDRETADAIVTLAVETGSTLFYDSLHIKSFMLNDTYPLNEIIRTFDKARVKNFLNFLKKRCEEEGI